MKKTQKKWLLTALFALVALYVILIVAIPYFTLSASAGVTVTAIYDHFVMMKDYVTGDVLFLAIIAGVLVVTYYFLIYRPKRIGKSKKTREISNVRKVVWYAILLYGLLLIAIPYITLQPSAAAWLVTFQDHFVTVKNAIASDFSFLALTGGLLGIGYYFFVYKPKL